MEESCNIIANSAITILDIAQCPRIHTAYSRLLLDGFCSQSYSGIYDIHVSHQATLVTFFALMVNAAVLYPHFKGKTMRHLCFCCYSKEHLEEMDLLVGKSHHEIMLEDGFASDDSDYDEDEQREDGDVELVQAACSHGYYKSADIFGEIEYEFDEKCSIHNPLRDYSGSAMMVRAAVNYEEASF